ncbi:helix-turn-helix transcriptional regulator [Halogranum rubrum]|uniref:Uncharacterized protein n=1 Tax=Halogranum salarium B-1 TaxID=1210908 RepID=J2ZLK2_9EURY|nr:hypothetical protein HSB1_00020 [Halogranum salarium B-1]
MGSRENIAFLVGSSSRIDLLRALAERPYRPTEIAKVCSCARETAQRTLGGFVERGWVQKSEAQYQLTPGGVSVLEQYEKLADVVQNAERLETFLTNAGSAIEDLPTETYDELTVTEVSNSNPHAPIDRFLTVLGSTPVESFKGITPVVSPVYNEAAASVIGPQTEMELVIDDSVLATSESEYPEALQRASDLSQFSLYLTPREIEFGLTIVDGHAYIGAYDEFNNVVASVDGRSEAILTWAQTLYSEYQRSATLLE